MHKSILFIYTNKNQLKGIMRDEAIYNSKTKQSKMKRTISIDNKRCLKPT